MNNTKGTVITLGLVIGLACSIATSPLWASAMYYAVGGRYHTTHRSFDEYPFHDGDITWQGGVEFHEGLGYWQLLLGYTPSVKSPTEPEIAEDGSILPEIDYIITPQLNLIIQDQGWLAGTGILSSYVKNEVESDWTKTYWQTMLGYQFRMQRFTLDIMAVYAFDSWSNISDFRFGDLEFSATLKKSF